MAPPLRPRFQARSRPAEPPAGTTQPGRRPREGRGGGASSGHVVSPPPPQHVLAARIGARRETASLALAELVREGLVEVSARAIVLPRPKALRAAIGAHLRGADAAGPLRSGRPER